MEKNKKKIVSCVLQSSLRLGVNVNNVFNEKYYNQALGNQMVPSAPCNFLASVSYSLR